jgi:[FeFe] hydrogenase H-cluster maturation GTPase HydF
MRNTPKTLRLHIGIFGRRNVGKSSLLNALTGQDVSIVSSLPGTTADPIEKPMELPRLGPVLFIDTAGIDDDGALGELRVQRSKQALDRVDMAILVAEAATWTPLEDWLIEEFKERGIPFFAAVNKCDAEQMSAAAMQSINVKGCAAIACSAATGEGIADVKDSISRLAPPGFFEDRKLVSDLLRPRDVALLVVPLDAQAPKGRLILPQAMAIRDLLDGGAMPMTCRADCVAAALSSLCAPPSIVITDSQAFGTVSKEVPESVPMTSFSILMARFQGDLAEMAKGAFAISKLKESDTILMAETCSHHPTSDDIGRAKIPNLLTTFIGAPLNFVHTSGRGFPDDLSKYSLVVHCGNCTGTRREMLGRINKCKDAAVPMTNYGLAIAYSLGILERALVPFPDVLESIRGS